jgi:phosphoglycolate phosphatase
VGALFCLVWQALRRPASGQDDRRPDQPADPLLRGPPHKDCTETVFSAGRFYETVHVTARGRSGRESENMMGCQAVIFDFDYTLVDSSRGVIDCVNHSLRQMKLPAAREEDIRRTIGLSIREAYRLLTDRPSPPEADQFARLFALRADQVMLENTFLFSSVRPSIVNLLSKRMRLGIVTSKFHYRIEAFLKRERLSDCFEIVVGAEDVSDLKPSPVGLKLALDKFRLDEGEAVYVGDSIVDAEAAARANVAFVAVLSGVTCKDAFRAYNTLGIVDGLTELPDLLESCRWARPTKRQE